MRAISLSRNFGKEAALSAGLDHVCGEAVIPIDVDMQDPPEVIGEMVARWREGNEVVYGVRRDRTTDSLPKRLTADLYYRAHNWLSADKIPEHAGDFRLLDRKVVDVIRRMPERNRFMKGLFAWSGFRQAAVEYDRGRAHRRHHQVQLLEAVAARRQTVSPRAPPCRCAYGAIWGRASRCWRWSMPAMSWRAPCSMGGTCRAILADGGDPVHGRRAAHLVGRARRTISAASW